MSSDFASSAVFSFASPFSSSVLSTSVSGISSSCCGSASISMAYAFWLIPIFSIKIEAVSKHSRSFFPGLHRPFFFTNFPPCFFLYSLFSRLSMVIYQNLSDRMKIRILDPFFRIYLLFPGRFHAGPNEPRMELSRINLPAGRLLCWLSTPRPPTHRACFDRRSN